MLKFHESQSSSLNVIERFNKGEEEKSDRIYNEQRERIREIINIKGMLR